MISIKKHTVPEDVTSVRLSDYACTIFSIIPSRKGIKKAIKRGEIYVDGRIGETGTWIHSGQEIELVDKELKPTKSLELKIVVIYEDDDLALINKPAGIVVSGNQYRTIENALLYNLKKSEAKDALKMPRPVHRLDALTSGLLLIAKSYSAHIHLSKQFEEKQIKKNYQAVVVGRIKEEGKILKPIDGKKAITHFRCLTKVPSLQNEFLSLIELDLETGRTHQLRKHLAFIGHPIVGDKLYGKEGAILKHKGLFLAAIKLRFIHPKTDEIKTIIIPAPAKFEALLERENRRWNKFRNNK